MNIFKNKKFPSHMSGGPVQEHATMSGDGLHATSEYDPGTTWSDMASMLTWTAFS